MGLPKDWDAEKDGPFRVLCGRCRKYQCEPTRSYKLLITGIVEQLYICPVCHWGTVVRYDPAEPRRHIPCQSISPGRGWAWVKPIPKNPAKIRK